ncbi:RNA binding protein [Rhodotorula toruloides ATCC 204091]|uniref:RNA binding protein n=1 Tax=Rhodotorula toruloides TaxID=5286 RepID=A0A0K3CFC9_RHOTO|nr:RNA binding protein [Rhodotorula toruloides ATCC 204091]PRQ74638.1 RNA binding protein [Rhodotorula toruloides]
MARSESPDMVAPYSFEVGSTWPDWDQGNSFAMRLIQKCIDDGFARKELSLSNRTHNSDTPPFKMVCDYHDFVKDDPLVPTPANKTCTFVVQLEPAEDGERHRVTAANLEHNHRLELQAHCFKHLREEEGAVLEECRQAIRKLAFEQARKLRKRYDFWSPSASKAHLFERQDQLLKDYAEALSPEETAAFVEALKLSGLYLEESQAAFSPTPSPSGSPAPPKRELPDSEGPASAVKKRLRTTASSKASPSLILSPDAVNVLLFGDAASLKKEDKPSGSKQGGTKKKTVQKAAQKPKPQFVKREPSNTPDKPFPPTNTFTDFLSRLSDSFEFSRFEPHFAALDITSEAQLLEVAAGGADELSALMDEVEKDVELGDWMMLGGMKKPWRNRLEKLLSERADV